MSVLCVSNTDAGREKVRTQLSQLGFFGSEDTGKKRKMYKSSINKILLSVSKDHTAHLMVTEMSQFVSFSAVLFSSRVSVAPSKAAAV